MVLVDPRESSSDVLRFEHWSRCLLTARPTETGEARKSCAVGATMK